MFIKTIQRGNAIIVSLAGEMDVSVSRFLKEELGACLAKADTVLIDFGNVIKADSAILATIVDVYENARSSNVSFGLVDLSRSVDNMMQLFKLDHLFPVFQSVDQALCRTK